MSWIKQAPWEGAGSGWPASMKVAAHISQLC
uniref:Uncharacterized protein n=1 Tax=Anguilla anguilla TaxID=7936 RepID=A0A0E9Q653_ANGAN